MKKLMALAAMVAMMLAAAAPAFAQDVDVTTGDSVEYNAVGQNIAGEINAVGVNAANANADAEAGDDAVAVATVDQDQDVSVVQSNVVLNDFNGDGFVDFFDLFWWLF